MRWICKFCTFVTRNHRRILEHYSSSHGHHGRRLALPCIYSDCVCSFQSQKSLRAHVRQHGFSSSEQVNLRIRCHLCNFEELVDIKLYFRRLGTHFRNKETVICPYNRCSFKFSAESSFRSHKSRRHNIVLTSSQMMMKMLT